MHEEFSFFFKCGDEYLIFCKCGAKEEVVVSISVESEDIFYIVTAYNKQTGIVIAVSIISS